MNTLKKMMERYRSIILYLIFGVLTTVVSIIIYAICIRLFALNPLIANVVSWIFSVTFAYVTNRIWVFETKNKGIKAVCLEMVRFFSGRIATLLLEEGILLIGINLMGIDVMLVKLVAQVLVVIANYLISKLLVFSDRQNK